MFESTLRLNKELCGDRDIWRSSYCGLLNASPLYQEKKVSTVEKQTDRQTEVMFNTNY